MKTVLLLHLGSVRWKRGRVRVAPTGSKYSGTCSWIISYPIPTRRRRLKLHTDSSSVFKTSSTTESYFFNHVFCFFLLVCLVSLCWSRTVVVFYNKLSIFIYSFFINFVVWSWKNILNKVSIYLMSSNLKYLLFYFILFYSDIEFLYLWVPRRG